MNDEIIAFVGRAARFSPDSVNKDHAILSAVRQHLQTTGFRCLEMVSEDDLTELPEADVYMSMARGGTTLDLLAEKEAAGRLVVNGTAAVMRCNYRSLLMNSLLCAGVAVPPLTGTEGYWVKRGFGCRQSAADVQYAPDYATAMQLRDEMLDRGIAAVDVRAHVVGDWLKFYGVAGAGFFYAYYPEGNSGNRLDEERLKSMLRLTLDSMEGLLVYGGDCVVREDGTPVLVDLNDWPSFSPCRQEAATAIKELIVNGASSLQKQ